jgi:hypothetical protein
MENSRAVNAQRCFSRLDRLRPICDFLMNSNVCLHSHAPLQAIPSLLMREFEVVTGNPRRCAALFAAHAPPAFLEHRKDIRAVPTSFSLTGLACEGVGVPKPIAERQLRAVSQDYRALNQMV